MAKEDRVLIGCAVGVAILSNGFRVFIVSLFAYKSILGYNKDIHGPLQLFQALFVSAIGYLVIFIAVILLKDRDNTTRQVALGDLGPLFRKMVANVRAVPGTIAVGLLFAAGPGLDMRWAGGKNK